eukprot:scaffold93247_cov62-Phaeocystis_antarctica.AAC.2
MRGLIHNAAYEEPAHDKHNITSTPNSRSRGSPSCGHGIIPLSAEAAVHVQRPDLVSHITYATGQSYRASGAAAFLPKE